MPNTLVYIRSKILKRLGNVRRVDGKVIKELLVAEIKGNRPRTRQNNSVMIYLDFAGNSLVGHKV